MADCIKNQFDPCGDSEFFEDPIEVVPYRMFFGLEPLSDFAVFQAVGDKSGHIFLATRQQGVLLRNY